MDLNTVHRISQVIQGCVFEVVPKIHGYGISGHGIEDFFIRVILVRAGLVKYSLTRVAGEAMYRRKSILHVLAWMGVLQYGLGSSLALKPPSLPLGGIEAKTVSELDPVGTTGPRVMGWLTRMPFQGSQCSGFVLVQAVPTWATFSPFLSSAAVLPFTASA